MVRGVTLIQRLVNATHAMMTARSSNREMIVKRLTGGSGVVYNELAASFANKDNRNQLFNGAESK